MLLNIMLMNICVCTYIYIKYIYIYIIIATRVTNYHVLSSSTTNETITIVVSVVSSLGWYMWMSLAKNGV